MEGEGDEFKSKQASKRDRTLYTTPSSMKLGVHFQGWRNGERQGVVGNLEIKV
jgi:hypothetical protein